MIADPFDLERFVEAQDRDGTYERAPAELTAGRKQGHWIWFVFPQIEGLGSSPTARRYGIGSLAEAAAYLEHPTLGPRLIAAAEALMALPTRDATSVLGGLDAIKLRSSMTLFARVGDAAPVFQRVLDEFYAGGPDDLTERRMEGSF
jgi:uncharacterized protein (DUF1810 family)